MLRQERDELLKDVVLLPWGGEGDAGLQDSFSEHRTTPTWGQGSLAPTLAPHSTECPAP